MERSLIILLLIGLSCIKAELDTEQILNNRDIADNFVYYREIRSLSKDISSPEEGDTRKELPVRPSKLQQKSSPKLYSSRDYLAEKKILPPHILREEEERNLKFPQLYNPSDHLAAKQVLPPHLREGRPYASFKAFYEKSEPEFGSVSEERLSQYGRVLNDGNLFTFN